MSDFNDFGVAWQIGSSLADAASALSSSNFRDAALAPTLNRYLAADAEGAMLCNYKLNKKQALTLDAAQVPRPAHPTDFHEHAAHKALENFTLYVRLPGHLNSTDVVGFFSLKEFKARKIAQIAGLSNWEVANPVYTPRDSTRYRQAADFGFTADFKPTVLFLGDSTHYLDGGALFALKQEFPTVKRFLMTGFFPDEVAEKRQSYYPNHYTLSYPEREPDVFLYHLEGNLADCYEQSISRTKFWMDCGNLVNAQDPSDIIGVERLHSFRAQALLIATPGLENKRKVDHLDVPEIIDLPSVLEHQQVKHAPVSVLRHAMLHARSLRTLGERDPHAKIRSEISSGEFSWVDIPTADTVAALVLLGTQYRQKPTFTVLQTALDRFKVWFIELCHRILPTLVFSFFFPAEAARRFILQHTSGSPSYHHIYLKTKTVTPVDCLYNELPPQQQTDWYGRQPLQLAIPDPKRPEAIAHAAAPHIVGKIASPEPVVPVHPVQGQPTRPKSPPGIPNRPQDETDELFNEIMMGLHDSPAPFVPSTKPLNIPTSDSASDDSFDSMQDVPPVRIKRLPANTFYQKNKHPKDFEFIAEQALSDSVKSDITGRWEDNTAPITRPFVPPLLAPPPRPGSPPGFEETGQADDLTTHAKLEALAFNVETSYSLRKTDYPPNDCLIRAVAQAVQQDPQDVWERLASLVPYDQLRAYWDETTAGPIAHLQILCTLYNIRGEILYDLYPNGAPHSVGVFDGRSVGFKWSQRNGVGHIELWDLDVRRPFTHITTFQELHMAASNPDPNSWNRLPVRAPAPDPNNSEVIKSRQKRYDNFLAWLDKKSPKKMHRCVSLLDNVLDSPWQDCTIDVKRGKNYWDEWKGHTTGNINNFLIKKEGIDRMDGLVSSSTPRTIKVSMTLGAPGSIKSKPIRDLINSNPDPFYNAFCAVFPRAFLRKDWREKIPNVDKFKTYIFKTYEAASLACAQVLVIEEITQMPSGIVDFYAMVMPNLTHILILGDPNQHHYAPSDPKCLLRSLNNEVERFMPYATKYRAFSGRLAQVPASYYQIPTLSTEKGFVKIVRTLRPGLPILVASQAEVSAYSARGNHQVLTYSESEGLEFDGDYQVVLTNSSLEACTYETSFTAMTRGKKGVYIVNTLGREKNQFILNNKHWGRFFGSKPSTYFLHDLPAHFFRLRNVSPILSSINCGKLRNLGEAVSHSHDEKFESLEPTQKVYYERPVIPTVAEPLIPSGKATEDLIRTYLPKATHPHFWKELEPLKVARTLK